MTVGISRGIAARIPFVFHNTSLVAAYNEPGVTDLLEKQMCDAWLNFARDGKPSSEGPCRSGRLAPQTTKRP